MPFELGSKKAVDSAVEVFKHGVETRGGGSASSCVETRGGVCKELCGDGVGAFSERKNAQGIRTSKDLKKDCKGGKKS